MPIMVNAAHRLANVAWRLTRLDNTRASTTGRPKCDGHIFNTKNRTNSPFVPRTILIGNRSPGSVSPETQTQYASQIISST